MQPVESTGGRREMIIHQATGLFIQRGYKGIAMREIAEAVGISKAALYYHFENKEELFLAILEANLEITGHLLDQASSEKGVRAQVSEFVRGVFSLSAEERAVIRLAPDELSQMDDRVRRAFGRVYDEKFLQPIEALLAAGIASGELRPMNARYATWLLLGMMYPFFTPRPEGSAAETREVIELVTGTFFDGVKHSHAQP